MQRLICLLRGHARIKGRAWREGGNHFARCTRCGTTLFRDPDGVWRAARQRDLAPRTIDLRQTAGDDETSDPLAAASSPEEAAR